MQHSERPGSERVSACASLAAALLLASGLFPLRAAPACSAQAPAATPAGAAVYTYDVTAEGLVHVAIRPAVDGMLLLPVTAENIRATDLTYEAQPDWESFTCALAVRITGPAPLLTYDWPDGALPWPVRVSNWLPESDRRWFADVFRIQGPAEAALVLPAGATVIEYREADCARREERTDDGRLRVVFDVPAGRKPARWIVGVIYDWPWADRYAVYGESPTPVYFPKSLERHAEYMARVRRLYEAAREFHAAYSARLKCVPEDDIVQYAINWLQGYGGAFCTGRNCYYDYRRVAAFEWPPLADGGRLMGAYHEMSHCFQPEGLPDYLGGHTWVAYQTLYYDWETFPNPAEVQQRKAEGRQADERYTEAYRLYRALRDKGMVPPLWYAWPESDAAAEAFLKERKCTEPFRVVRECASTHVMLVLERELGAGYWGRFATVCNAAGVESAGIAEPVQQQIMAAWLSAAAGRDLTARLIELTDCDLAVRLSGAGANLVRDDGWTLDAWQPTAAFERDASVRHGDRPALKLACPEPNDARLIQKVAVEPRTHYLIVAWVRTEDVPRGRSGATVGVLPDPGSVAVTGTRAWRRLGRVVWSDDATELVFALRLGWQGAPAPGTAWFADVEVYPLLTEPGWQRLLGPAAAARPADTVAR